MLPMTKTFGATTMTSGKRMIPQAGKRRVAIWAAAAWLAGAGSAYAEKWPNLDPAFVIHPLHSLTPAPALRSC